MWHAKQALFAKNPGGNCSIQLLIVNNLLISFVEFRVISVDNYVNNLAKIKPREKGVNSWLIEHGRKELRPCPVM